MRFPGTKHIAAVAVCLTLAAGTTMVATPASAHSTPRTFFDSCGSHFTLLVRVSRHNNVRWVGFNTLYQSSGTAVIKIYNGRKTRSGQRKRIYYKRVTVARGDMGWKGGERIGRPKLYPGARVFYSYTDRRSGRRCFNLVHLR